MHKVHYNNEIVEKFHTNMAGKTLCTYVLMSKKEVRVQVFHCPHLPYSFPLSPLTFHLEYNVAFQ